MKKLGMLMGEIQNKSRPKNLSKEFQYYGCMICEVLGDTKNYSLYIKLAKENNRAILEEALNFVKGYPQAKSRAKLFMWKLKALKDIKKAMVDT